jgi:tetratricopeptide (TPR) repeat protein
MAKSIKRRKITRHELKEDRFLETTKNFITFFSANKSRIVLTAIVLVAIAIALRIFFNNKRNVEEIARIKKLYADAQYENGNFNEAIPAYMEIIQMHGGSTTGKISKLFLANCYYYIGDLDNALENYEKSLKVLGKNKYWASAALIGIASVYEQQGIFEDAIEKYSEVINKYVETPAHIEALFSKARCLEFLNRYTEAIDVYQIIKSEYSETQFSDDAEKRIVFLSGAVESERISP